MALTIKLQSPKFNNNNMGEEIALPVSVDTYGGTSLAAIVTLFSGSNIILDLGQLREVVRLTGVLTPKAATDAGYDNPVHHRDAIRNTRSVWPLEDGTLAGADWSTATLPSDEQDSELRAFGKSRLIFEKRWNDGTNQYEPFILYGTVGDFTFPNRMAASNRDKIPFGITFLVGTVQTTQ